MKRKTARQKPASQKFSLYMGAAVSSWLLAIMVIAAEMATPFKDALKGIFTHHWIGKLVIVAIVFAAAGFMLKNKSQFGKYSDESVAWYSVIGGLAVILLFFIIEYFK